MTARLLLAVLLSGAILLTPAGPVHAQSNKTGQRQSTTKGKKTSKASPSPAAKRSKTKSGSKTKSASRKSGTPKPSPSPSPSASPTASPSPSASPSASASASPSASPSPTPSASPTPKAPRVNASIATDKIKNFANNPDRVKQIIQSGLELTRRDLTYAFGSADPANGGLDCSGFIYYVLRQNGISEVPRTASGQYIWARKAGLFRAVNSHRADSFELDELRPGDLLFWIGTYATQNDPPISHTMIYLGIEADTGHRIMVDSSEGRTYHGKKRDGASVFDFTLPKAAKPSAKSPGSRFIGYSRIPGL